MARKLMLWLIALSVGGCTITTGFYLEQDWADPFKDPAPVNAKAKLEIKKEF